MFKIGEKSSTPARSFRERAPVAAARSAVEVAQKSVAKEGERLAAARQALEAKLEAIRQADPDAPEFAELVRTRIEAQSRVEALEGRDAAARQALEKAQADVVAAERADALEQLDLVDGAIRAEERELMAKVAALADEFAKVAERQRERHDKAAALKVRATTPGVAARGYWIARSAEAGGPPGRVLQHAALLLELGYAPPKRECDRGEERPLSRGAAPGGANP